MNRTKTGGHIAMSILQQPILVAAAATDSLLAPALVFTAIVVAALFAIALSPGLS